MTDRDRCFTGVYIYTNIYVTVHNSLEITLAAHVRNSFFLGTLNLQVLMIKIQKKYSRYKNTYRGYLRTELLTQILEVRLIREMNS